MTHRSVRRAGFTLLETMAAMAALGVCMVIGSGLIVTTLRADGSGEAASNRVNWRTELSRQFRDDVARAAAAPDRVGTLAAGPARLILQMTDGSYVLYEWVIDKLERAERRGDGETRRSMPLAAKTTSVEFVRPAQGSRLVTVRVAESSGTGAAKTTELAAALGGNSP